MISDTNLLAFDLEVEQKLNIKCNFMSLCSLVLHFGKSVCGFKFQVFNFSQNPAVLSSADDRI